VQRTVGLPVAATVEPVTELLAGRGVQWRDPHRCANDPSLCSRSGLSPALTSSVAATWVPTPCSASRPGAHPTTRVQLTGELDRFDLELVVAAGEQPQCLLGRLGRGVELGAGT
jgi:hypothetical protein